MPETGLYYQDSFLPWSALRSYNGEDPLLLFCRDWLTGRASFTFFTSGSSGKPKAIEIHRNLMVASAKATATVLKPQKDDVFLLSLNPKTIGGAMILVRAMEWNISVYHLPAEGNPLQNLPSNHPCTLCSLVPLQVHDIFQEPESFNILQKFRAVLLGGAALNQNLLDGIESLQPSMYHTYGMTETCSHIALRQLNGINKQEHFHPLPGVKLSLDKDDTLVIDAPTAIENPLKTNDIAHIFPDGSFEILGRADRTLISGGIKIQLDEMEKLFANALDKPFFLYGLADERLGEKLVLFIESEPFPTHELEQNLRRISPEYKAPKAIIFVPRFARTASGKIDRINTSQQWARIN